MTSSWYEWKRYIGRNGQLCPIPVWESRRARAYTLGWPIPYISRNVVKEEIYPLSRFREMYGIDQLYVYRTFESVKDGHDGVVRIVPCVHVVDGC